VKSAQSAFTNPQVYSAVNRQLLIKQALATRRSILYTRVISFRKPK